MENGMAAFLTGYFIFLFAFVIFYIFVMWKIYVKAGYQGWECIIPIYSTLIKLRIVGKPWWWIFMFLIPAVNIVFAIWMTNMLSKSFGKDEGFTVGLIMLGFIFYPILAFGEAQYQGPFGDPQAFAEYRNRGFFDFDQNRLDRQ